MKLRHSLFCTSALLLHAGPAGAQGTFLYDQQSANEAGIREGGADIQPNQPIGQSFTPSLQAIGFVRLFVYDVTFGNSPGTLSVDLRADSITGTVLASTLGVVLPPHFVGFTNFYFANPIDLTPGTAYYLRPEVLSGNIWGLSASTYNYAGGDAFAHGAPDPTRDLWFREGLMVPEPSCAMLILAAAGVTVWFRSVRAARGTTKDTKDTKV